MILCMVKVVGWNKIFPPKICEYNFYQSYVN